MIFKGGGGYIYELRGKLSFVQSNLTELKKNKWIDRQTRSISVHFTVYNPNINVFSVTKFLFEVLPSGNLIKSAQFEVFNLFTDYQTDSILLIAGLIYMGLICFFMVREIIKIIKKKKKYLKNIGIFNQWMLFAFSWASFAIFIFRYYTGEKVKQFFNETSGYGYINLDYMVYWNQVLNVLIALCTCLASFKLIELLKLNSSITIVINSVQKSSDGIIGIGTIFFVLFVAFVQLFYIVFNQNRVGFSTVIKTTETLFLYVSCI